MGMGKELKLTTLKRVLQNDNTDLPGFRLITIQFLAILPIISLV